MPSGEYRGVEAVIDKDLSAALLACELEADGLVMLTDVEAAYLNWYTPMARPIHKPALSTLRSIPFSRGSMGPKVEAACRFVERTGGWAAIGALAGGSEVVAGRRGTMVEMGLTFQMG
jgi:carbamate kinase